MEDLLDLSAEPYDRHYPLVCFDEKLYQLVSEVRQALPVRPGQPRRYDDEYRREGTYNVLMFVEPSQGWRHVKVTNRRTAQDFALCMKDLVDVHFPEATVVSVVLDNLNTHTPAALYATFPTAEALPYPAEVGCSLYAQAWQLAQHGGNRIRGGIDPMLGPTSGTPRDGPQHDRRLGNMPQCRQGHH